eukprot:CAMPEP_0206516814 /NCGR_PEP_ID=MMETSP0324_2-20121206/63580_1 /ASSEMBLY_ACC=CAM_ASM_000836 /TAXON_ID=2866 /ORGANISM="Crypthecodinium cohnii, Strain Seligo" /LENGTH=523 /DNA_ID=CAMNT_0054009797 /DNA_START=214 /DNA_END=1785 /DNA_ORIENTATION=-
MNQAVVVLPPLMPSSLDGKVPSRGRATLAKRSPLTNTSCPPGDIARGGQAQRRSRSVDATTALLSPDGIVVPVKTGLGKGNQRSASAFASAACVSEPQSARAGRVSSGTSAARHGIAEEGRGVSREREPAVTCTKADTSAKVNSASHAKANDREGRRRSTGRASSQQGESRPKRRALRIEGHPSGQQQGGEQEEGGGGGGDGGGGGGGRREEVILHGARKQERLAAPWIVLEQNERFEDHHSFEGAHSHSSKIFLVPDREREEAQEQGRQACSAMEPDETDTNRGQGISTLFVEDFSWGRNFSDYIGAGYLPPALEERLAPMDLIQQLFELRKEMKAKIRYESGRLTIRRPGKGKGMNKPVTYASNIWNRGYANCAGLCIVFVAALTRLGVPYCIVSARSCKEGLPKHAIVQVGFPELTDIKAVNGRAKLLWGEYYGRFAEVRRDPETQEPRWVRLFRGLKFTRSSKGSAAAQHKGPGRWLWLDPQVKIGYYLHLIEDGYIVQDRNRFSFAVTPEIKAWSGGG